MRRLHRDLLVVGLARPRGAGVGGLEEQRRHPGQVQKCGYAEAERAVDQPRPALGGRSQDQQRQPHHEHRRAEEERPVVRVQRDRQREPEQHRPAPRGALVDGVGAQVERGREEAQQHHERVHPRLLPVLRDVRVAGGEHGREPGGAAAEHEPGAPERERDDGQREDQRQRVRGALTAVGERDPHVEQAVVERRRAVLAQDARDVGQRPVGDPDREALVDPVADAQFLVAQPEAPPDEQRETDGHDDPRGCEGADPRRPRRA